MKHIIILILLLSTHLLMAQKKTDTKALEIVKKSVKAHGGDAYKNLNVSFDFRQFQYKIVLNKSKYLYQRTFQDSIGNTIVDLLDNGQFSRTVNGNKIELTERDHGRFKEATNSVAYFMLLPYKLLDKAVNLEYLGETDFENNKYYKIKVLKMYIVIGSINQTIK